MAASGGASWPGPDGIPRRTSPLTVVGALVPVAFGLLFLVIAASVTASVNDSTTSTSRPTSATSSRSTSSSSPVFPLIFGGAMVLAGAAQVLRWYSTTYTVLPTELVVDEGILSREHRVLPYARVQQADTHQNLLGQILGLTELRVDSAGSSGSTQIKLRLLDASTASALRDYVLRRRADLQHQPGPAPGSGPDPRRAAPAGWPAPPGSGPGGAPPPSGFGPGAAPGVGIGMAGSWAGPVDPGAYEVPVLALGAGRLAVAALTHSTLIIGVPVVLVVALWAAAIASVNSSTRGTGLVLFGSIPLVVIAAFLVVIHIISTVVNRYGFHVALAGDDIHLRFGLFETRNLTVPRRRVQQITIADNPLRRVLGLVELHLHTAAAPGERQATTRFSIPIARRDEIDHLVTTLMGDHTWAVPPITPRTAPARRRAVTRRMLAILVVVAVPAVLLRPAGLSFVLLVLLGIPWGLTAHARAGHGTSGTVVALTHGVLHHRIDLVPRNRVQSCRTYRSPFQRMSGLSTLYVDVAGSSLSPFLWDLDAQVATDLRRGLPRDLDSDPDRGYRAPTARPDHASPPAWPSGSTTPVSGRY